MTLLPTGNVTFRRIVAISIPVNTSVFSQAFLPKLMHLLLALAHFRRLKCQ